LVRIGSAVLPQFCTHILTYIRIHKYVPVGSERNKLNNNYIADYLHIGKTLEKIKKSRK